MTQMTSRQRVDAAFAHREPDRTPVFEYVLLSPLADTLLGRPFVADAHWEAALAELGWEGAVRQRARDRLDLAARLGHDLLCVGPNPVPEPVDAEPKPWALPPTSGDPVEALSRRNAADAESLAPPADASLLIYAALGEEMRRRDLDLPILAPAYTHGIWTDTDLMQAMVLAPEVAAEHFALATAQSLARIERYLELGIDLVGIGGDFAGQRPMISPEMYRRFIVPEVRQLSQRLHAAGARAVNASDGDLWPVIDDFLIGCQVDAYLEIDLHAGMDLSRLKTEYGDRITLIGNLDCGNTLSFSSPDEVRAHVTECLEAGQGNGGHILCASNAITASVPLANYLAVIDAHRVFFGLEPFDLQA